MGERKRAIDARPEWREYWSEENPIPYEQLTTGSHVEGIFICTRGHRFTEEVKKAFSRRRFLCYPCREENSIAVQYPHLLPHWSEKNKLNPRNVAHDGDAAIYWICEAGHEQRTKASNHARRFICNSCTPRTPKSALDSFPHLELLWSPSNGVSLSQVEAHGRERYWFICPEGHEWQRSIYRQAAILTTCPLCEGGGAVSDALPHLTVEWSSSNALESHRVSQGSHGKATWLCPEGHAFTREIRDQVRRKRACPICSSNGGSTSTLEMEVKEALYNMGVPLLENQRLHPGVGEVDIHLPHLGIAIDVNGEYWHSNTIACQGGKWSSAREKHLHKQATLREIGVQLYFAWEDDWKHHRGELLEAISQLCAEKPPHPMLLRLDSNRDTA